jgi:hypothetical protein
MTITEAMRAVSDEYDAECGRTKQDKAYGALMMTCIWQEYAEMDEELPKYVAQVCVANGAPEGILPFWIYQLARMSFRLGMRTQRKLDHPEEPSSIFWRSDGTPV